MIDEATTVRLRRGPVPGGTAAPARPAMSWQGPPMVTTVPGAPAPWGPPPAGLGGPGTGGMPGMPMHPGIAPPARRPRWPWVLGAVAAVVVVLGLFGTVLAPATTVSGTVNFYMSNYLPMGSSCEGMGINSDLRAGGSVSVHDGAGKLVGVGSMSTGTVRSSSSSSSSSYSVGDVCAFPYSVSDVESSDYYVVSVGSGRGAGVPFSEDEIDGNADIRVGS
ncbi:hypothetical protein ACR9E3_16355 [Actinomycetospora sp. C-140]